MTAAEVQTSERVDCTLELTGVLHHVEVAMKALGDGSFVPALVLQLDDVGAGRHRVVAHVTYPRDRRDQAEEQAKQLHRGDRVTVTTSLLDMRLLLPAASLFPQQTREGGFS
jgi:hypothetical protein